MIKAWQERMLRRLTAELITVALVLVLLVCTGMAALSGACSKYHAPPAVNSVTPRQGTQGQTLSVIISGTYLPGAMSVNIDDATVSSFTVNSSVQITAVITIGVDAVPGAKDVSVTTPGGTATLAGRFMVLAASLPTVTAISPTEGTQGQTLGVAISGTRLSGATSVSIRNTTVHHYTVDNDTQITAVISIGAAAAPGAKDVSVTTAGGSATLPGGFTVLQGSSASASMIIDHRCVYISAIPKQWIDKARTDLHIAYGHTSHGSQITTGMTGLVSFTGAPYGGSTYAWGTGGVDGALDLRDSPFSGAFDLGNPDRTAWATATRAYLNDNPDVNVIMWSWCGQADGSEADIQNYLNLMSALEKDYPGVRFVYMTGHTNGTGLTGNLHLRNQQIRDYCVANNKILYDFEDIESYDPDGRYFGDKNVTDSCNYDGGNWATEWQDSHIQGIDWYQCPSEHSQPLNANLKAYGAWWMWARLAGWDGNAS